MHDKPLEVVQDTKYLGITIKDDIIWNLHINNIVSIELPFFALVLFCLYFPVYRDPILLHCTPLLVELVC
jgi:hypothetical protein